MNTIKITPNLLFEYQCTSCKFIRLPNRIESKKIDSIARIESKLFCPNWNALMSSSNEAPEELRFVMHLLSEYRTLSRPTVYFPLPMHVGTYCFLQPKLCALSCPCLNVDAEARDVSNALLIVKDTRLWSDQPINQYSFITAWQNAGQQLEVKGNTVTHTHTHTHTPV